MVSKKKIIDTFFLMCILGVNFLSTEFLLHIEPIKSALAAQGILVILIAVVLIKISLGYYGGFSYFTVFLCFSIVFVFGQHFVLMLGATINYQLLSILSGFFSKKELIITGRFIVNCFVFLTIGYVWNDRRNQMSSTKEKSSKELRLVGYIFLGISFIPTMYSKIHEAIILKTLGYDATFTKDFGVLVKVFEMCEMLCNFSIIILLVTGKTKKQRKIAYAFLLVCAIVDIMGGSRITSFRYAVLVLLVQYFMVKKFRTREIVKYGAIGLFVLLIFSCVSAIRAQVSTSNGALELIIQTSKEIWENNILVTALSECGIGMIINALVYTRTPSVIPYCYGYSIVKILLAPIPRFWPGVHPSSVTTDSIFSPLYGNTGLGSSYMAEIYYNFGEITGYFVVLLFGLLLGYIWKKFLQSIQGGNDLKTIIWMYILYILIFTVRSDFGDIFRSVVYCSIFLWITIQVLRGLNIVRTQTDVYTNGE